MTWNLNNIVFLHQPDYFLGRFDNPKMQERHEKELGRNLKALKEALANERDPLTALRLLNKNDHIKFLRNNLEEFRRKSCLEETVLALYCRENGPFSSGGDQTVWEHLFNDCDREKLRKYGKPIPSDLKRLYRGSVTGIPESLAWTSDRKLVEKFSLRWNDPAQGGGELYEVDASPEHVLVYLQKKHEEVVILSPQYIHSADIRPYNS